MKKCIWLVIILLGVYACKNNSRTESEIASELILIDSLDFQLNNIKSLLDRTSYQDLHERIETIDHNYDYCKTQITEKKLKEDEETTRLLDEYKALGYIYQKAVLHHKKIVLKLEDLYAQSKTLRKSARAKDYNKETYKQYYNQQRSDILNLNRLCADVLKPVIDTDLTFERREAEVEALAESLK